MTTLREHIQQGVDKRVAEKMRALDKRLREGKPIDGKLDGKMTNEEKLARMSERDQAICRYYAEGHKLSECSSRFRLGKQRTMQILKEGGVWKPYEKNKRTKFLGVNVTPETKAALEEEAERKDVSVSKLVADKLDAAVGAE